ncbi:helix-turn-helix transcriptional regulator [Bifidobacterium sp. ESL0769]|uniref:helix-turn-helix transcriptional regulator n=1 Tax=Bifidobacterium sp. ESL0769 TaxID=2983229 RepID=UPI0023F9F84A|nr:helix-turn-helix transcriptional regulator [Bifidobacterium sp. ESL0769]WEV67478.1 helix-turn-helix transcriptional regulator [Bifidobacterium sp. ESL0769]
MALPSIELMTLGALKDHPMSAYDINKFLASRGVSNWVQVSEQSVYRIAIKLCDDCYTSIDTDDSAASSQKRVYSITPKGAQHFDDLMNEIASAPPHITFDFVAMVANLYQTDEATGRRLLTTLETNHRSVAEWMRSSVADLPFSEASETVLLCADTYALIARWAHHFQENFYHDAKSADTNEPEDENDDNIENANFQSKSTDFVIVTPLQTHNQNDSTEEKTKMQGQNEPTEEPNGATTSNHAPSYDATGANTTSNTSTASETSASQTPNQNRLETSANKDSIQNSPTVIVKNQRFTGSLPITKLDFHLHSMAGRITTQSSDSDTFEIKFHHCKASDFQISNTAGTLHIANTGTPWDHMSLMNVFNPAQWNAYVEVIIPASQPLTQTTAALNSSSLVIAGLESRNFDLNLHGSSAKINDITVDAASLITHGGSVKWNGTVHNNLDIDCHNSSARISGLPRNFGYLAEIHSSTLTVDGQPIIANRHSASRPGTPMVDVNLHSSSISLD